MDDFHCTGNETSLQECGRVTVDVSTVPGQLQYYTATTSKAVTRFLPGSGSAQPEPFYSTVCNADDSHAK
jgi:hypothetical protein